MSRFKTQREFDALGPGDQIDWMDPDDGAIHNITIRKIEFIRNGFAHITDRHGTTYPVLFDEIV
jgi:hypothetical protein